MTGQPTVAERFWAKVNKNGPVPVRKPELGPCWVWTAGVDEKGYGQFNDGQRSRKAHAFSYELEYEEIPDGLEPDHLCRNRPCIRPDHLEAVTHRENCQRAKYAVETCSRDHQLPPPGPNGRRVCRECANISNRAYKERQRKAAPPKPQKPAIHGRSRYVHHGCRCDVCREAEAQYSKDRRRDQSMRIYDAVMGRTP